jgi:hypothetical protein
MSFLFHGSLTPYIPYNQVSIHLFSNLSIPTPAQSQHTTVQKQHWPYQFYKNETSSLRSWRQERLINSRCCGRALWKAATVLRSMFSSHLLPRLCLIVNSVATMLTCSAACRSSPNCDKADSWSWTKIPHQNCDLVWEIYTKHKRKCV